MMKANFEELVESCRLMVVHKPASDKLVLYLVPLLSKTTQWLIAPPETAPPETSAMRPWFEWVRSFKDFRRADKEDYKH